MPNRFEIRTFSFFKTTLPPKKILIFKNLNDILLLRQFLVFLVNLLIKNHNFRIHNIIKRIFLYFFLFSLEHR